MDFTPKKQPLSAVNASQLRHNPYASGGSRFYSKYKNQRSSLTLTSPRTNVRRRFHTRTDKILSNAKLNLAPDKNVKGKTPTRTKSSPHAPKRPFCAINGGDQDSKDPYNVFTDSDEENQPSPRKESKGQITYNKENFCQSSDDEIFVHSNKEYSKPLSVQNSKNIFDNPKPKTVKVYSNKKKTIYSNKSRLVNDISPEKIEKAYGTVTVVAAEKENWPVQDVAGPSTSQVLVPHMIGFPNYGNTCYLNSVLQSLFGLPTFLCDYRHIASELGLNSTSLFYGLGQVLNNRMKGQTSGVKMSLRTVKENLERIDESFSGFKMQDANEFLTKVLDTIKDEIDKCYESRSNATVSPSRESLECNASEEVLDEDVLLSGEKKKDAYRKLDFTEGESSKEIVNCLSENCDNKLCDEEEDRGNGVDPSSLTDHPSESDVVNGLKNPVKDNFEFQLLESYRCLGCGDVEGRTQSYFGLYVNLPEDGGHTLQDAVATYMGVDERELTCEKCNHDTSSVVTSIRTLPRILIIQLKRYEYKPEQCESIKMSSKVLVNRWISLDGFMTDDVAGPEYWNPESKSSLQKPQQGTLSVRNLSSELNKSEPKEEEELPLLMPKPPADATTSTADNEDEELQMVMRRSMEEVQGVQEDDEIQQAIRLSLQEMGMSYSQDNQEEKTSEQKDTEEQAISVEENEETGEHAYCLISIISHFGLTTNTGHYVSDVYNCEEDSWFHYDDESVAKISESVVFAEGRQKNGYIFFYMHKDLFQKLKNKR